MSTMGNTGTEDLHEDNQPEMKEQRRKNITAVLQRLSDKQSSGYESEKEGELYSATQTPTEPRVPSIYEIESDVDAGIGHSMDLAQTYHTYSRSEFEHVETMVGDSKTRHESWVRFQQEVVQESSVTSHSICHPIPKPLPSSAFPNQPAYKGFEASSSGSSEMRFIQETANPFQEESPRLACSTSPIQYREPVIVPRHQSPFHRPHLWRSPTHGPLSKKDGRQTESTVTSGEGYAWKPHEGSPSRERVSKNIELFPPPECMSASSEKQTESVSEKRDTSSEQGKKDPMPYHKSFKKCLQERYISSLKDSESMESISAPKEPILPEGPKKRLDEIRSESDLKNPSFSSTDSEGREVALHTEVFFRVRDMEDSPKHDESIEAKDDVFESAESVPTIHHRELPHTSSSSQRMRRGTTEEPLDLTSKQALRSHAGHMSQDTGEEMRSPAQYSQQLSPSMYHHSPPMFYSPQHEIVSPRSPLWSVPEGRVFNFNLPSPFTEPRCHSDPEFLSPGFSPDSPGLHFTFPPRSPYLGSGGGDQLHSRMPKSPRLVYPGSPSRFPSNKPLPKLFCSPPQGADFQRPPNGASQGSELTYICPVCGQVFPSYDNLAKHMAKHLPTETIKTADNNKVHYCKVCNRAFSRSDMLTRHMRLHTGLKPYECRVCGQVFSRSDHLNTHQRTHTGEKPYRCPQCPYAACRRDMITRHMRIHLKRSSKRGRYLSVPEGESPDVRKSSVSSTDTTDSQEHSGRTCSVSSVDSVESESGNRKCSTTTSGDSFETESIPLSAPSGRLWSCASGESTDFEENPHARQSTSAFYVDSPGPFLEPTFSYRKPRNWSTTSFESIDSEGSGSRRDSVADDFGDIGMKETPEGQSSRDTPVIDDDSLRKFTISSDDIQN